MIAHVSLPARNPRATAQLLAQLIDGVTFDFPVVPGAAIAVARDGSGLAIEVYPQEMAHHPGAGTVDARIPVTGPQAMPWEDQIHADGPQVRASAFHAAITTPLGEDEVIALAKAAGLRALGCERGGVFRVIEVWLDNTTLIEVLTSHEAERYQAFMNPQGCATMFGPPLAAAAPG